jgi:hypothetical protein
MNTDERDGAAAESQLRERLARQFAEELGRAERDYRTLRGPRWNPVERLQPRRRMKLRLAVEGLGVVVLLVVGLVVYGQVRTPAAPGGSAVSAAPFVTAGIVIGPDGIPSEIHGEPVYGVADQATWQNLSGSFLLSAVPYITEVPAEPYCNTGVGNAASAATTPPVGASGTPEICLRIALDAPPARSIGSGIKFDPSMPVVTKGSSTPLLESWVDIAIVLRVHIHDAVAAGCSTADSATVQAACDAEVVVEAVVWPEVPTEIAGQRVYRFSDQASIPTSGSFLLGGPFTKPADVPPCPAPIGKSEAEQQLIPYCYDVSIDGIGVAPMSNIDEPNDEIVVARVHINDPLAAQCPAEVRADCQAAIVVEAVVWSSDDLLTSSPSAGPSASLPLGIPAPTQGSGPATPIRTVVTPPPIAPTATPRRT